MKITGGQWTGRNIRVPKGVRPTTARSKEVLFGLIGDRIPNTLVIDLFCGSGALGLDALSRGADQVFFVDRSMRAIHAVRSNIEIMGVEECSTVIPGDAFRVLNKLASQGHRADVITADPPYDSELADRILQSVDESGIMVPGGWLVVEYRSGEKISESACASFTLVKSRKLGDTVISIWEWSPAV